MRTLKSWKGEQNINIILLAILLSRLSFIFSNAINENSISKHLSTQPANNPVSSIQNSVSNIDPSQIVTESASPEPHTAILIEKVQNNANLTEDIGILENMYKQSKDLKILKTLIEKLAQNYEFEKANTYLQELLTNPEYNQDFDPNLHLYILLHDSSFISITEPQSIQKILPIMDTYKVKGLLSLDDYKFYEGLIKIRNKDYEGAKIIFNSITTPRYQSTIQAVKKAIISYNSSLNIPKYYQDGLVGLSLLKNGYFSIAKKLALQAALQDSKYILPYQILAYTHFLTNNRETATEYFLKLADVDEINKNMYKFLIGISFYRSQDYQQAILYLAQVNNKSLQTDTYRYIILSYLQEDDTSNAVATRQKLLGQNEIQQSDYYSYFYQAFYRPYLDSIKPVIYEENTILADMYLNNCKNSFTGTTADVCIFGEIGGELIKTKNLANFQHVNRLTTLANKYNSRFLFQIIGDIFVIDKNKLQAKENYAKALSLVSNEQRAKTLQDKIKKIEE